MFFEALVVLLAAPFIPFLAVCFILAILDVKLSKVFCKMTIIWAPSVKAPGFSEKPAFKWLSLPSVHNIGHQSNFIVVARQTLSPGVSCL